MCRLIQQRVTRQEWISAWWLRPIRQLLDEIGLLGWVNVCRILQCFKAFHFLEAKGEAL